MSVVWPLILTLILVWTIPPFNTYPFEFPDTAQFRRADYKLVASALYDEHLFEQSGDAFWKALTRTARRQGRFLAWFYLFVGAEGLIFGGLAISYPRLAKYPWYRWTAGKILFPNIPAWHVLLTPFFFQQKGATVWADILCTDGTLYRGRIIQHLLDKEGELSGIIITDAKRYARDMYLKEKEKGPVNKEDYWRTIPGAKLYIFSDKILNLNLAYEAPLPPEVVLGEIISKILRQRVSVSSVQAKAEGSKPAATQFDHSI